MNVVLSLVRND